LGRTARPEGRINGVGAQDIPSQDAAGPSRNEPVSDEKTATQMVAARTNHRIEEKKIVIAL